MGIGDTKIVDADLISDNDEMGGDALRIAVAGTGYVGLSLALLLARKHRVCAVDIVAKRVESPSMHGKYRQDERNIEAS